MSCLQITAHSGACHQEQQQHGKCEIPIDQQPSTQSNADTCIVCRNECAEVLLISEVEITYNKRQGNYYYCRQYPTQRYSQSSSHFSHLLVLHLFLALKSYQLSIQALYASGLVTIYSNKQLPAGIPITYYRMQSIKRSIYGLFKHRSSQQKETFKLSILESQQLGHSVVQSVGEYSVISASEWDNIILKKSFAIVDHSTLYFSVLKGLPNNLRFKIWLLMTDQSKCITTAQYVKLLDKSVAPESLQQIAKDIPRSFSDNQKYSGMRHQMQRILKISSLRPHGYIQGMNFILLYVMIICAHSQKGDEWCGPIHEMEYQKNIYCIFTHILDNLSQVFSPNAEGIYKLIAQLDQKISQNVPQIGYHFAKCGFESVSLFSANYYSLMMAAKPPLELAKSILDLFMLEGRKAIHALIVRMLQLYSQKILSIQQPMQLQKLIKTQMFQNCAQLLIQDKIKAHSIKDFGIAFYQQIQLTN